MTQEELRNLHGIQDALFWWRYHRRMARDIYCDSATEHEYLADDMRHEIIERIRRVQSIRRRNRVRVAA